MPKPAFQTPTAQSSTGQLAILFCRFFNTTMVMFILLPVLIQTLIHPFKLVRAYTLNILRFILVYLVPHLLILVVYKRLLQSNFRSSNNTSASLFINNINKTITLISKQFIYLYHYPIYCICTITIIHDNK